MKKIGGMLKRVFKIIRLEEMQILPGQLAFFIVLSIIAIFSLIGFIGSSFISNELINTFKTTLPSAVSSIFSSLVDTKNSGVNIILFSITSIYIASTGCESMILTSNIIYKLKATGFVKRKIKAIIMTLILIVLILFIVLVPAFGELIINAIKSNYPGKLINTIDKIYNVLEYPLSFVMIFIGIKILYTLSPDKSIPSKYTNYGALFTTISWIIITKVYAVYLNNINTYNIFYGSLANVVIMLFWIYLLAYVFTMGMALNSERYLSQEV